MSRIYGLVLQRLCIFLGQTNLLNVYLFLKCLPRILCIFLCCKHVSISPILSKNVLLMLLCYREKLLIPTNSNDWGLKQFNSIQSKEFHIRVKKELQHIVITMATVLLLVFQYETIACL